ncbi:MAG TPA: SLC13 family permease [Acidimicrobiia bacterium]
MAFVALAVLLVVVARGAAPRIELAVAVACVGIVLVTGALTLSVAGDTLDALAPTLGFLLAVFVTAEVARDAGLFRAAGQVVDRHAHSPRALVVAVALLAALVTAVLSLDATAVLFTPVVVALVARQPPPAPERSLVATAQMANASSLLLPVSNLTNLLVFPATGLTFPAFALRMAPATAVAVVVVTWVGARKVPGRAQERPAAATAAPLDRFGRFVLAMIVVLLVGFSLSGVVGLEPVWIAAAVAVVLAVAVLGTRRLAPQRVLTATAVEFVGFVAALSLVVAAAQDDGLGDAVAHLVPSGAGFAALLGIAVLGAVLANLVNNLPATLILLAAIPTGAVPQLLALLVGVNVGPNVTYTGSLATLLWRREVRASGVEPRRRAFYRFAFLATPLALVGAVAALWLTLQVV